MNFIRLPNVHYYSFHNDSDFFYAENVSSDLVWTYIGTVQSVGSGSLEISKSFNVPFGSDTQAVRVQFRFGYSYYISPCKYSAYADRDDLIFDVLAPGKSLHALTPIHDSR